GKLIYELGCGPPPVRIKKLTPQILATALDDLSAAEAHDWSPGGNWTRAGQLTIEPLAPRHVPGSHIPGSPSAQALDSDTNAAYRAALARLFARTGGAWRLGLERVSALLEALGNPQRAYPVFHVAGTNGKGSTVATLDAVMRHAGLRVARYTSPHLVNFNERVIVDGQPMRRESITAWLTANEPLLAELGATFFEATTAMALSHFANAGAEVAIVEVGLGGRLDATNVVEPIAAGVTQIGFDHMEFLGDSLLQIANEKAGIFKAGRAAIIGETRPDIRDVLVAHAEAIGASPILATGRDWQVRDVALAESGTTFTLRTGGRERRLSTPLVGTFQAHNAAVAFAMLEGAGPPWKHIAERGAGGLTDVRLSGRFHHWGPWLFDVAHNADGAASVVANVRATGLPLPVVAVVTVLRDKDWRGILRAVSTVADRIFLTSAPTAPASRAWDLNEVAAWTREVAISATRVDDFDEALRQAELTGSTILVTGSFHTVGDAMERLQVDPLAR
ncbi:MAG: folylpolyglutamate synthase/dihydrofolate synthase family protein, partial [Gemmatimonas sp.]